MSRGLLLHGALRHLGGWRRDLPDHRDGEHTSRILHALSSLPEPGQAHDGSDVRPPILDQGAEGRCTGHGGRGVVDALALRMGKKDEPDRSPQFIYDGARLKEHTPLTEDSGAQIRDVMRALLTYGSCSEATWPSTDPANWTAMPSAAAFAEGAQHRVDKGPGGYYRLPGLDSMKRSIADRYPVVFGFRCFASLESAEVGRTGLIPYPERGERGIGGHCVVADSFDGALKIGSEVGALIGPNSWGEEWGGSYKIENGVGVWTPGGGGLFALPFRYVVAMLAADLWTVRRAAL
jgi:hypothetical protein